MRPVDKGEAPDRQFNQYQEAEPYLEERLGAYCSFCEMSINHVPEVEHREAAMKRHGKICCFPANTVIPAKARL